MKSIGLSFLVLSPGLVSAYALPEACSGTCTNSHDLSVIARPDGTYFRFSTGGNIAVHTAPNIAGPWTYKGPAISGGSVINLPGNRDLWAPDVTRVGDMFYLYYSVSTFGSQTSAIGVARSSTLDVGTWQDLGSIGLDSDQTNPYNSIDSNLLIDANGTALLCFGSWWKGLHQVQLDAEPTAVKQDSQAVQLGFDPGDPATEGGYMFKNGEFYYLFYSRAKCCGYDNDRPAAGEEYRILVCRSTTATGGFVDQDGTPCTNGGGTIVLKSHNWVYGPGGQGVYRDPTHGPILYYHYVDTRIGYADSQKRFGWNKIDFSSGWPVV